MIRLAFLLLLACAAPLQARERTPSYAGREDVAGFVGEMHERHGFDSAALDALFRRTHRIDAVLRAIRPPADPGIRSWQNYRARFVEPRRIGAGRAFLARHRHTLAAAEQRFGVPPEIVVAIIGIETLYGRDTGRFGSFAALATLAFDYPPRAALFRRELEELLLLAREEGRDPLSYAGSYAGALGLPQFLPSSRRRHAVDFDGDGRIDLSASVDDAIGSVAAFLAAHGWENGAPIADAVVADGPGVAALVEEGIAPRLTAAEMAAGGTKLRRVGGGDTPGAGGGDLPERPAALVDFVSPGAETEYRLGYRNFWVITRYNRSSFYAAAVMDLAASLRGSE